MGQVRYNSRQDGHYYYFSCFLQTLCESAIYFVLTLSVYV